MVSKKGCHAANAATKPNLLIHIETKSGLSVPIGKTGCSK